MVLVLIDVCQFEIICETTRLTVSYVSNRKLTLEPVELFVRPESAVRRGGWPPAINVNAS